MDAPLATHPTDQTLSSYGLGKLDDASAESVNKHLEQCPDCRNRVAAISPDTFLGRLRGAQGRPDSPGPIGPSLAGLSMLAAGSPSPAPPATSTLPPGLADHPDYEILRELGQGGMGVVYLAENRLMGRKEVLKVVSGHLINRRGVLDRFLGEIRHAAQLHHPNIVTAYAALRVGESLVLAMEYVEGLDLARLVKARGPLPVAKASNYVHQAALGLQHAHEHGMVHRDIKPGNLMLAPQGYRAVVKVLDFGLAKVSREVPADGTLTYEGQMLGTPDFIAPEQSVDARNADIRADIYSLGCTLYYLLTGGPPFQGTSLYDILQAHHSRDALPLNLARPEVPVELAALVAKMMAKEPERRFQTPAEVSKALTPFFKPGVNPGSGPSPEISRVGEAAPSPQRVGGGPAPALPATFGTAPAPAPRGPSKPNPEGVAWESLIKFKEAEEPIVPAKPKPARKPKHVPEPATAEVPVQRPPWRSWRMFAAASVLGAFLLGVIIFVTNNGRIKIVVNGPRPIVKIDGETVRIEGLDGPITLRAGTHELAVKWGPGEFKTGTFVVRRGDNEELRVEYEPKPSLDKAPLPSPVESISRTITDSMLMIRPGIPDFGTHYKDTFPFQVDRNIRATVRDGRDYVNEAYGRKDVLVTQPFSRSSPGIIDFSRITKDGTGSLILWVHGYPGASGPENSRQVRWRHN